jgi:hypothetical protein
MNEELLNRITKAKIQQVTAATELWNVRLELFQQSGDLRGMLDHLRTPIELAGDNCGCNSACGVVPESGFGRLVNPTLSR